MEGSGDGFEVEKKTGYDVGDLTETCTKSCSEAYKDYLDNGRKICPHYHGKYFIERFFRVLNRGEMESTKCMDAVGQICDLFKKDGSDGK